MAYVAGEDRYSNQLLPRQRESCQFADGELHIASANAGGDCSAAELPSRFEVNYVRVYQKQERLLR